MSKKASNIKLLIILVVLLAAIAVVKLMDSKQGERNFRKELVDIDTSEVTAIHVYPKSLPGEEIELFKENDQWKVKTGVNKSVPVTENTVPGILRDLNALSPKRLAAKTSSRWKDFQVDTSATRVEVYEGGEKTLDLVLGKFSFKKTSNNMETFVRLSEEDETYVVDGFFEPMLNNGADYWRENTIIKGNKEDWINLSYTLPSFSSFQLQLQDSLWKVGAEVADQAEVEKYLNSISQLTGSSFADDVDISTLGTPDYVLEITNQQGDKIKVEGFVTPDGKQIIRSSLNPDNIFKEKSETNNLFETIFVGKPKFFPEEQAELIEN